MGRSVFVARALAILVALIGILVLLGWITSNEALVRLAPSLSPMVMNTAIGFLLCGITLFLQTLTRSVAANRTSLVTALIVGLLGLLTLLEYIFDASLGIDLIVGDGALGNPNPFVGRMSVLTSFNFFVISKCLLAHGLKLRDKKLFGQYAIILVLLIAVLSLTSTLLGAEHFYSHITTMAVHTAFGFVLLCLGYFAMCSDEGIPALLLSKTLAGKLSRSILVPLAILYPVLSFIRLWGEQQNFYNAAGGTAFMMVAGLGLFIMITLVSAQMVAWLDREKEEYKKFFELSSEMLVIAGTDGHIKLASESFSKLLGYTPSEVLTTPYVNFVHPDDHPSLEATLLKLYKGESVSRFPLRLKTKTGHIKHYLWSVTPELKTGNLFAAGYDVTEIKEAEQVRALAEKLSIQNKQLASFAHIVSHNLRSPVGNLNALLELHKIASPEERHDLFDKFHRVADHLSSTLNDLVDSLRIKEDITKERDTLHFEKILNKTKEILTAQILESGATITNNFNRQPVIHYPQIYLESIFLNLLSNAIKYRSHDRPLRVHFQTLEINKYIVLTVEDNGQGIDMARNGEKLFGFYKAFHQSKDSKGMGLFLTKTQVEAMGGSINAFSQLGKGTTFTIALGPVNGQA
jgi:PAS domain S-box-containing protein